ncbi:MAG TPA: carboxypeptidase-like regulatory domain-containing protein, partial [Labilithrix sp.]
AEAIYANDEDQEIAAIDDATHAEKWYWPIAPPDPLRTLRFVFANDGQAALYAESFADGEPSVVVFRRGAAPPVTLVHVEGHVLFEGRPVAGAAVRARSSSTRSNAAGAFTLDVPARGTFRILATARGVGPAPCRSASGAASGAPGDTSPVMIDLASACDQSDE